MRCALPSPWPLPARSGCRHGWPSYDADVSEEVRLNADDASTETEGMRTMTFTASELSYLGSQPIGRRATVRRDGSPQVSPVGFSYNDEFGTIDIGGFNMS